MWPRMADRRPPYDSAAGGRGGAGRGLLQGVRASVREGQGIGESAGPSYRSLLFYHLLPLLALLAVFFNLRPILPMINPVTYDDALYQVDLAIFGFEPTLFVEKWSSPAVIEWFSFFYYSYFF